MFEVKSDKAIVQNTDVENPNLKIVRCEHEKLSSGKGVFYSNALQEYILIYIVAGKIKIGLKSKSFELENNTFLLLKSQKEVKFEVTSSDGCEIYALAYSGEKATFYNNLMGFAKRNCFLFQGFPREIIHCFQSIFECKTMSAISSYFARCFFYLVTLLFENNCNLSQKENNDCSQYINETLHYIDVWYNKEDLSIEMVAKKLFIHKNYLSRLIKNELGVRFSQLLLQRRIKNALKMFNEGATCVAEVAYACGFRDPLYFSKLFKRQQGFTPSEYIKKLRSSSQKE